MKIADVYKIKVIKNAIQDLLEAGEALNQDNIEAGLKGYIDTDLSRPRFTKTIAQVVRGEEAEAVSWKTLLNTAKEDLETLFLSATELIDKNVVLSERWNEELTGLEKEIDGLSLRAEELLHSLSDTTGYFSHISDDFRTEKSFQNIARMQNFPLAEALAGTDITQGNFIPARVDIGLHAVSIPSSVDGTSATTLIDLHEILEENISFTIQTIKHLVSNSLASHSKLYYIFSPKAQVWKSIVRMKKAGQVTGVLQAKIGEESQSFSRIDIHLHTVTPHSITTITPQYSLDKQNWSFLPNVNVAKTGNDIIQFIFPPVLAKYIRFIMQKESYDYEERGLYVYEFGAEAIQFYNDTFDTTKLAYYQTTDLTPYEGSNLLKRARNDMDLGPFRFNKLSCEICEDVPEETEIRYYASVDEGTSWHSFDPINRPNPTKPMVLDFGKGGEWAIAGPIKISWDETKGLDFKEAFPGRAFTRLYWDDANKTVADESDTTNQKRYIPLKQTHGILTHVFDSAIGVVPDNLKVWRNVGELGTDETVRNVLRGWRLEEAHYVTIVDITNPRGFTIDLGQRKASIDHGPMKSGTITIPYGQHVFKTHKENWIDVAQGATTFVELLRTDPLYPHNHKLLIEGYTYGVGFPDNKKVYTGVDRWASHLLKRTDFGTFKVLGDKEYGKYVWKTGIPYDANNYATAIIIKFDPTNADFANERFVLEFSRAEQTWESVRFLAVLETRNANVSPMFSKWVLRLSQ